MLDSLGQCGGDCSIPFNLVNSLSLWLQDLAIKVGGPKFGCCREKKGFMNNLTCLFGNMYRWLFDPLFFYFPISHYDKFLWAVIVIQRENWEIKCNRWPNYALLSIISSKPAKNNLNPKNREFWWKKMGFSQKTEIQILYN